MHLAHTDDDDTKEVFRKKNSGLNGCACSF